MGNEYILGTFDIEDKLKQKGKIFLSIFEMSNRLQLEVHSALDFDAFDTGINIVQATPAITPEEMMKIFIEGIKVCSYWMTDHDVQRLLRTIETYDI